MSQHDFAIFITLRFQGYIITAERLFKYRLGKLDLDISEWLSNLTMAL